MKIKVRSLCYNLKSCLTCNKNICILKSRNVRFSNEYIDHQNIFWIWNWCSDRIERKTRITNDEALLDH